jgi:hypothetical protein
MWDWGQTELKTILVAPPPIIVVLEKSTILYEKSTPIGDKCLTKVKKIR